MPLTLNFYNLVDDPRVVNKTLGTARRVTNVFLKDEQNVVNPTFILTRPSTGGDERYIYCPELNRYYFVDNVTIESGNKVTYGCTEDVLMTYREQIMNTDVVVFHQGDAALANRLISDERIPLQVNTESRTFNFKNGELGNHTVDTYSIVLNCFGGMKGASTG